MSNRNLELRPFNRRLLLGGYGSCIQNLEFDQVFRVSSNQESSGLLSLGYWKADAWQRVLGDPVPDLSLVSGDSDSR